MGEAPENTYYRRPYSLQQEENAFHLRDPKTGIILGAEPFCFKGSGAGAVLMVHGYTSTPRDLRDLGIALSRAGYTAKGILLPGHGTKPTDLDKIQWTQWYDAVVEAYHALRKEHEVVHAAGFSMGGALAMHLAAHHPVGKLVLLSPLLKIAYNPCHVIPQEWLVYTIGRLLRHLKKKSTGNCNDAEARQRHIAYFHYALSSINQALALVNVINREIKAITNPVLIIHGKRDKTTSPAASRRLYDRLPSRDKRFVWLPRANHIITHDFGHETVTGEVLEFLTRR